MNLKKLFNYSYFKENIKKSKSVLAFFFGVVPLLNILVMITCLYDAKARIDLNTISTITTLGLYLIPFILAFSLFGFLFKKSSVDFVVSKPLSRRSIYITNIIGGIIILFGFIFLNALIFFMFDLFTSLTIPFLLILDYAIYFFVAYLFLFSISSLAITLAGNLMTSLVLIMIIVCLIPFIKISTNYFSFNDTNYIKCTEEACTPSKYYCYENEECISHLNKQEYKIDIEKELNMNLTAPIKLLFTYEYNEPLFVTKEVVKMAILSLLYFIVGFLKFKYRKMENNETSFKSSWMHFLVKTITFIPVSFICYILLREESSIIILLIILAAVFIYYVIYDLITRREIYKPKESLVICLISLGLISGFYASLDYLKIDEVINISEIDAITFNYGIKITDQNLIKTMLKETLDASYENDNSFYIKSRVTKGNQNYVIYLKLSQETNLMITDLFQEYYQNYITKFPYDKVTYVERNGKSIPLNKEIKNLIKNASKEITSDNSFDSIQLYVYQNHEYQSINLSLTDQKLYEYILNQEYIDFKEAILNSENTNNYFYLENTTEYFTSIDGYVFSYLLNSNLSSFKNYLNNYNLPAINDEKVKVFYHNGKEKYEIIVNAKEFYQEYTSYQEKLKDDETYQTLIKEYLNLNGDQNAEY